MARKYRFVGHQGEHSVDEIQVAANKTISFDPNKNKPAVSLTDDQYQSASRYARLEEEQSDSESQEESSQSSEEQTQAASGAASQSGRQAVGRDR